MMRLKEEHPLAKDVQRVFDLMDELGLVFSDGAMIVSKNEGSCLVVDQDSGETVGSIPPLCEFKLVRPE
jgi:hypothetical protein